jgi:two-component system NtrC family sensor kinase
MNAALDVIDAPAFDRAYTLGSFVASVDRQRLAHSLETLLGPEFVLEDERGLPLVVGSAPRGALPAVPIVHELEPIGRVSAACAPTELVAAAALLQILIAAAARERMTSELHLAATQDSYRALAEKHSALEASEVRYRELAGQLEARVQQQVGVIESAQRQLFQAEKMASVGQLAAGMAHEINNPIGFIQSNLRTARDYAAQLRRLAPAVKSGDGAQAAALWQREDLDFVLDDFSALIDESVSGAQRIARIVADLKVFSSIDAAGDTPVDLGESLRIVTRLAQTQIGAHALLALDFDALPPVRGDAGKLNQVFLSLIQNADQAVPEGGEICIRGRVEGAWLRVEVEDNGCGIAPDTLQRVFDPFFTTRVVGQGTGLGLTVSRDIIAAHGGTIEIDSELGRGTRVVVSLPVGA